MLTKKQHELLLFIHNSMKGSDVAPSFEEMKNALGLKSKSGIHRLISALVERGYLQRLPHRARALEILKLPENIENQDNEPPVPSPAHIPIQDNFESIPLYGRIAAGTPIEAIRDEISTVQVPPFMLTGKEQYALEVDGDSMIKAGINDGDIVIIEKAQSAENGQIVVALVDDEDVTLKRLRRSGNKIILEPENDDHEPQVLEPERVKVQGKLISLFRTY